MTENSSTSSFRGNHYHFSMQIFLIFVFFLAMVNTDCPISFGPRDTQIDVFFNNDPSQHDRQLTYSRPLSFTAQKLKTIQTPKVAVSKRSLILVITAMDYDLKNRIGFDIAYRPLIGSSGLKTIIFAVTVNDQEGNYGWKRLKWTFIVSLSNLLEFQIVQPVKMDRMSANQYVLALKRSQPIQSKVEGKDIKIQIYVSGIHAVGMKQAQSTKQQMSFRLNPQSYKISGDSQQTLSVVLRVNPFTTIEYIAMSLIIYGDDFLRENSRVSGNDIGLIEDQTNNVNQNFDSLLLGRIMNEVSLKSTGKTSAPTTIQISAPELSQSTQTLKPMSPSSYDPIQIDFTGGPRTTAPPYQQISPILRIPSLSNMETFIIGLSGLTTVTHSHIELDLILSQISPSAFITISTKTSQNLYVHLSYSAFTRKTSNLCEECSGSPIVFQNFCLSRCPISYVKIFDQNLQNYQCKFCNLAQLMLPNADETECVCAKQHFMKKPQNKCRPCHFTCLQCDGQGANSCLSCDTERQTTKRSIVIGKLPNSCRCPSGYYDDPSQQNIKCLKCHYSCQECSGSRQQDCNKCAEGRALDKQTKRCLCINGYSEDLNTKLCACQSPKYLLGNRCLSPLNRCGLNQRFNSSKGFCQCDQNSYYTNGQCIRCLSDQVFSESLNQCICLLGFKNSKTGKCIFCESVKNEQYDFKIEQCVCKSNYLRNSISGRCQPCQKRSQVINGRCECVFNYYYNGKECARCKKQTDGPRCFDLRDLYRY